MRNAGLEEAQAGIKIAGRNIDNLSYADDNTPHLISHLIQTIFYGLFKKRSWKVVFFIKIPELEIVFDEGIYLDAFWMIQTIRS